MRIGVCMRVDVCMAAPAASRALAWSNAGDSHPTDSCFGSGCMPRCKPPAVYIVMAYIVMAYKVMAYIVMAYIVMAACHAANPQRPVAFA